MMTMFEKMLREDLGFGDITSELTVPEGFGSKRNGHSQRGLCGFWPKILK